MRFRRPEWDIEMPAPLVNYWAAWNEPDTDAIRSHLDLAVAAALEWHDPRDSYSSIDELEQGIRELRSTKPEYRFVVASKIDHHNGRLRYRWDLLRRDRVLMEGLDVATLDRESGLIARVDGFFGHPTPLDGGGPASGPAPRSGDDHP